MISFYRVVSVDTKQRFKVGVHIEL